MFSKMFAFYLFLAALSVEADREKRRPGSGGEQSDTIGEEMMGV